MTGARRPAKNYNAGARARKTHIYMRALCAPTHSHPPTPPPIYKGGGVGRCMRVHTHEKQTEKNGKIWLLSCCVLYNYIKGKNGHSPTRAHALASAASEAGAQMVATAAAVNHHPGGLFLGCTPDIAGRAVFPAVFLCCGWMESPGRFDGLQARHKPAKLLFFCCGFCLLNAVNRRAHAIGQTRKRGSKARPRIMRARFGQTLYEGCKAHARAKAVFWLSARFSLLRCIITHPAAR